MKKIILLSTLFVIVTALGCESNKSVGSFEEQRRDVGIGIEMNAPEVSYEGEIPTVRSKEKPKIYSNRKMIWSADLEFQVEDMEASTDALQNVVRSLGGFVSGMSRSSTNYRIQNQFQIRIGNEQFDALVQQIKGQATFLDRVDIRSEDVTEEFVDIESRLATKKEARERYLDILRNKTGDVKDIIEAEEAIRKITEEIEAKEGRLRFLKDKVSLSTVSVLIYQEVDHKKEPIVFHEPYSQKIQAAFTSGWSVVTGFLLVLVNVWPVIILLAAFLIWKRKWLRRAKKA